MPHRPRVTREPVRVAGRHRDGWPVDPLGDYRQGTTGCTVGRYQTQSEGANRVGSCRLTTRGPASPAWQGRVSDKAKPEVKPKAGRQGKGLRATSGGSDKWGRDRRLRATAISRGRERAKDLGRDSETLRNLKATADEVHAGGRLGDPQDCRQWDRPKEAELKGVRGSRDSEGAVQPTGRSQDVEP